MERKHDVSPTEKEMLSNIASDLLTGNHLLGRPRTLEYKRLLSEFTTAAEIANEGKRLTRRQAALLKEKETRKKVAKIAKHKIFSSVGEKGKR